MRIILPFIAACVLLAGWLVWSVAQSWLRSTQTDRANTVRAVEPNAAAPPTEPNAPPPAVEVAVAPEPNEPNVAAPPPRRVTEVRWAGEAERSRVRKRLKRARAALTQDPSHLPALEDVAAVLVELERWAEAAAVLEKIVALAPDDRAAQVRLAEVHMRLGNWLSAAEQYEAVVAGDPNDVRGWHNLATARQAAGHLAAARRAWSRVIALNPDQGEAYARRGAAAADLGDWSAAAADFAQAVRYDPTDAQQVVNLAAALLAMERVDEAADRLRELLERQPRHLAALRLMGRVQWRTYELRRGDAARAAAVAAWRAALEIDPNQPGVRVLLDAANADTE